MPIEIKHTVSPSRRDLAAIDAFLDLYPRTAQRGILVSMRPRIEHLSARIINVPLGLILHGP